MFTCKTPVLAALAAVGIAAATAHADTYYGGGYSTAAYPTYSTYSSYAAPACTPSYAPMYTPGYATAYAPAYRPSVAYAPAPSCPPPVVIYQPAPPVWQRPVVIYHPYEPNFGNRGYDHDHDDARFRINFHW